jgi:hypothetical protein
MARRFTRAARIAERDRYHVGRPKARPTWCGLSGSLA